MRVLKTIHFSSKKPPETDPKKKEALDKINKLVENTSEIVCRIKSVFPFDFFPDEIVVTRKKVDIIYGVFFSTREVISLLFENISEVTVDYSLFFASLTFEPVRPQIDPDPVRYLKRSDAILVRRIIIGMMVAKKENIDLDNLEIDQLREKMIQLGIAGEGKVYS